jgi:1-acyl-sn-glycerol-3-phosphate acyltransferase
MFYLRLLGALLAFLAASVYGLAIALGRRDRSRVAYDYAQRLARWMQPPLGLEVSLRGAEHLRAHRPCIFVANHQSVLDVPVLAPAFAPGSVVIAKREVGAIPFFGWLYRATGNLLIDRADTQQSVGRLQEAEAAVRARGAAVWIFPEGTRGKEPGRLLPFKKGGFRMAVNTGAPVVPVVVSPLKPRWDLKERRLERGRVVVQVLEPVPTAGMGEADVVPLMETVHARMQAALTGAARELGLPTPPPGPAVADGQRGGGGSLPGPSTGMNS